MNAKLLAELLRTSADRLDGGTWDEDSHTALIEAARRSAPYEIAGNVQDDDPHKMSRTRWNALSARDKAAFLRGGGKLFDETGGEK